MFDGITIRCPINDFGRWKEQIQESAPDIHFALPVETETGNCRKKVYPTHTTYRHCAKFETYQLYVFETHKGGAVKYTLRICGSLHKNYYKGKNFRPFTHTQAIWEISHVCNALQLEPEKCRISVLEFGVNIVLDQQPIQYIDDCVLLHQTTEFIPYAMSGGKCLGRHARHEQYELKIYDKGLQYDLPNYLMRVELRFTKMQKLNKIGIYNLADLINVDYLSRLQKLLLTAWHEVLVSDPGISSSKDPELVQKGQYRDYWRKLIQLDTIRFNYQRKKYRQLTPHANTVIANLINTEWDQLQDYPNLPLG